MKAISSAIVILFLVTLTTRAALQDFDITAQREKLSEERANSNIVKVTAKEIRYRITVKNRNFRALEDVEVKYRLFYVDTDAGSPMPGRLLNKTGAMKFPLVGANALVEVETDPFTLTTEKLSSGYYYTEGGSNKNRDQVVGLWVRVYSKGQLMQEYCNPSTLTKKAEWKD